MLPRTILVGISLGGDAICELELTETDQRLLDQALWLASKTGAKVRLHHTIDWIVGTNATVLKQLQDAANARAIEVLGDVANSCNCGDVVVETCTSIGKPAEELLRVARSVDAGLLVVGPHVRPAGISGLFHGSTARRLVRECEVPVWIVPDDAPVGINKLVAAVDLKPVSEAVVSIAGSLAEATSSDRAVLHCLSFPSDIVLHRLPDAAEAVAAYHKEVEGEAREKIASLLGDASGWEVELAEDYVVRVLPKFVEARGVDLVVMAGVSAPGIAGKLMGTTAEKVLKRLTCSVIVVKPEGWAAE